MYNFKEAKLGPDFAKDKLKDFKTLIDRGISFVTIAMPGVGASYFLKYLATRDFARLAPRLQRRSARAERAYFIHIDFYELPALTQNEFYKLLLSELGGNPAKKLNEQLLAEIKTILKALSEKEDKIVIIFNRFDQLKKEFDAHFLSNIQSLTAINQDKIVLTTKVVCIFTATKPLYEIAPDAMSGGNLNFYSENLYFKPYSIADLKKILAIDPGRLTTQENLDRLLELCGGHNQLLHIFLSSQKEQLILDQFVKMQFKELVDYLNYTQRKQIQNIALRQVLRSRGPQDRGAQGKLLGDINIDEYLLGVGMVKKVGSGYQLFTPLFAEYISANFPTKLPVKEAKLFKLLRKNIGNVVSKDEIFTEVWGDPSADGSEGATDWALDALIYRLRKHPFIKSQGYIIESQKKVGYSLIQI